MDRENFESTITRYLEKFEDTNGNRHEEFFKWQAIDCFQKNWDIEAEDLYDSFSRAIKETDVLLDGGHASPSSGIKSLLKIPEEVAFVRDAFRKLFDDSGDLDQRDAQVHSFIRDMNARIKKYWPNDGYKPQSSRAALCYLTLHNPKDNFFYMFSKAENWACFTEYGWDLGSGANFSLPVYYRMCEELVREIENSPKLRECDQNRRAKAGVTIDDHYHTLAYDIIYCATTYHLYMDLPIYYPISVKNRLQRAKEMAEINALAETAARAEAELHAIESGALLPPVLVGHAVTHKKFGNGTIEMQSAKILNVRFGEEIIKMGYPNAITDRHLKLADGDLAAVLATEEARTKHEKLAAAAKTASEEHEKAVSEFNNKWKKSVHNEAVTDEDDD